MTLSEELRWRGFVNQTTYSSLSKIDENKLSFYMGFDASADSLTIGNLAALMLNKTLARHGNHAYMLAGGATSLIGDPGGKDSERPMQSVETIEANVAAVAKQIKQLFSGTGQKVTMVNNLDWTKDVKVLDFLRDVGKHFSMTPLIQRDYIAKRLGKDGDGISYTEFSYTLLQGFDFLHLYRKYGVTLQVAGSDQWGNSLSGVELIRRVEGKEVHVFTCPLIINKATGKKFGKSEDGAIWLDPAKTTPYRFYQYWLNVDDEGVGDYLKIFTELDKSTIDGVMKEFQSNRAGRAAQKRLAYEVTALVHGKKKADEQAATKQFGVLNKTNLKQLKESLITINIPTGTTLIQALVKSGLASSNSEALRFMVQGAVYLNNNKMAKDRPVAKDDLIGGHAVLRRGKNNSVLLALEN